MIFPLVCALLLTVGGEDSGWIVIAICIALIAELIISTIEEIRDENQPNDQP